MKHNPFHIQTATSWCPGCGNFGILNSLKEALLRAGIAPEEALIVSGIGQAAKLPHYVHTNGFNGLHGRALPVALGAQAANHQLKLIVSTGDGDALAEGGNHFVHAMRRNIDVVHLLHDNQVYGLTKGQASPTTPLGQKASLQPNGVNTPPINPITLAIASQCSFVARSFSGDPEHLSQMILKALAHKGYAIIDILQPCPSFNKVNTLKWYKEHIYHIDESHPKDDLSAAFALSLKWGEKEGIPIGVFYENPRPTFMDQFSFISETPLAHKKIDPRDIGYAIDRLSHE